MTDMISVVSRALARERGLDFDRCPKESDEMTSGQDLFLSQAEAAIQAHEAALEAKGLVIVPRVPSKAMVNKGSEGLDAYYHGAKDAPCEGSITACYKAMLAALEGKE